MLIFAFGIVSNGLAEEKLAELRTFSFSNESQIGFKANAFLHDFRGSTREVLGRFELDLNALNQPGRGAIEIDAATLNTKNKKRDALMRQDHLEVRKYPLIRYVIRKAVLETDDPVQQKADYLLDGELELHGTTRPVRVIATLNYRNPNKLKIAGTVPLALSDHQIKNPSVAWLFKVKDDIKVTFNLVAEPASPFLPKIEE